MSLLHVFFSSTHFLYHFPRSIYIYNRVIIAAFEFRPIILSVSHLKISIHVLIIQKFIQLINFCSQCLFAKESVELSHTRIKWAPMRNALLACIMHM